MSEPPKSQPDKFRDPACKLDCDEDKAAFKAAVRKIGAAPRETKPKADEPE